MNGTTMEQPEVAAYLAAVRSALADVPAEERDELLADVEASLLESGSEAMVRPPEAFASELREAAGLEPVSRTSSRLEMLLERLRHAASDSRLRELTPIWWVARGYVAVAVLAMLSGIGWPVGSGGFGAGTLSGTSGQQSFVLLLVGCAASVWLGLRARDASGTFRRVLLALNVVLALALVPVVADGLDKVDSHSVGYQTVEATPIPGLALDGVQLTNLYPYSRDGELLQDVLLYTNDGRPLDLATGPDENRRVLKTTDGTPLFNSFPIRYFDPGTRTVAHPELGPAVTVPTVTTPKLETPK